MKINFSPEIRNAISFTIFGDRVAGFDESQYVHRIDVKGIIDNLPRKGTIVWDKNTLKEKMDKENYRFLIINDNVYDVSGFYFGPYSFTKSNFFGREVQEIFDGALENFSQASSINAIDVSDQFAKLRRGRNTTDVYNRAIGCMGKLMYVGKVDRRNDLECKIADYILLAASVILVSVIGFKFLAALQCYNTSLPEESDKFAICQVPCYTEGNNSLKAAINSLATMKYDDKRKLIFLICDGMIQGAGNDQPTPRIVLDILGVDPNVDPEPLAYKSLGEGNAQLNYAKVYSGLYESNGHTVPYIVVVKVGKPSERQKPGNRYIIYIVN
jgi:chitin synthase